MYNRDISSILAYGQEVSILNNGGYVKINLPATTSILPYLVAKYTPSVNGRPEYYTILHTTRRKLANIDPLMEEDILWFMYKEYLYNLFNSLDKNSLKVEAISEDDVIPLIKRLYDYDKVISHDLLDRYSNICKYTRNI